MTLINSGELPEIEYRLDSIIAGNKFNDRFAPVVRWATDAKVWLSWSEEENRWIVGDEPVFEMGKTVPQWYYEVADLYAKTAGQLAYNLEINIVADGWTPAQTQEFIDALTNAATRYRTFAKETSNGGFGRMFARAQTEPVVGALMSSFDAHPDVLNTPGGVALLRRGDVVDHPAQWMMLTKMTRGCVGSCDLESKTGRWAEFLEWIQPNVESRAALQRCVGYSMLGTGVEKVSFFPYGEPDTGKTLFVEAIAWALGDYSTYISVDAFKAGSFASDKYALAALPGTRLLITSEFDAEMKINQNLLKSITGGEQVQVRQIRGVPFFCRPQCALWVPTNNLPYLGDDSGSWVRMVTIPFENSLEGHRFSWESEDNQKGDLAKLFRSFDMSSEILEWVLEGVRLYTALGGLSVPEFWKDKAAAEREAQTPPVDVWVRENFIKRMDGYTAASMLYDHYTVCLKELGQKAVSQIMFGKAMSKAGFTKDPAKRSGPNGTTGRGWDATCSALSLTEQWRK